VFFFVDLICEDWNQSKLLDNTAASIDKPLKLVVVQSLKKLLCCKLRSTTLWVEVVIEEAVLLAVDLLSITLISTKNMLTSLTAKQFRIACVKQDKETEINEAKDGDGNNTKAKLPT
jgi:hypothetical protein